MTIKQGSAQIHKIKNSTQRFFVIVERKIPFINQESRLIVFLKVRCSLLVKKSLRWENGIIPTIPLLNIFKLCAHDMVTSYHTEANLKFFDYVSVKILGYYTQPTVKHLMQRS